ncbi:MAG: valine--tRNA ligase, partial [Methanobacteriota archaeon]
MADIGKYSKSIEEKLVEKWEEEELYKFVDDGSKKPYVIDSPPPFTSGKLHMGHILSYTMFDIDARYRRMSGYAVLYAQGWDTQGFPTEVKVEAKYGRLPREEFIRKCKEWTQEHIESMRKQAKRFAFSSDWSREYITMEPSYHYKVQKSLVDMYKGGDIY